jgi:hypothetical protein
MSSKQRAPLDFWRNSSDDDEEEADDDDDVVLVTKVTPATIRPLLVDEQPNHDPRSSTRSRPAPRSNRVSLTPQLKAGTNASSSTARWDQELDDTSDDADSASDDSSNVVRRPSVLLRTKKNQTTTISSMPRNTTNRGGDALSSSADNAASTRRTQPLRQNLGVKDLNSRGYRQAPEKGSRVQGSTRQQQQQEDSDGNPSLLGDDNDDSSQDTDTIPARKLQSDIIGGTSRKEPAGSPVLPEDDDSEDTATLTRRLRHNLVKKDGVPPREIFTLSPSSSTDEESEHAPPPHDNDVSSLQRRGGDFSSENEYAFDDTINDDQSVATAELVGRLRSNLGGPSTVGKVKTSLLADSSSPKLASTFSAPMEDDSEEDSLDRDNNMPSMNHDCDDVVDDESADTAHQLAQGLRVNNLEPQAFQLSIRSQRDPVQFELPSQSSSSSEDDGPQGSEAGGGTNDWAPSPNPSQHAPYTSGRRESHSKCVRQKLPSIAPASTARRLNQPPFSITEASSARVNKGRVTVNPYTEKIKYAKNGAGSSQQHLDAVMVEMSQPAQQPRGVFQSLPPALTSAPLAAAVPLHGTRSNRSDHGQHSVLEHMNELATKCSSRDLYEDAFGVPRSPDRSCARSEHSKGTSRGYQHITITTDPEPTNQQLFMEASGGQGNSDGRTRSLDNSTVVLVDSDNEDDHKLPICDAQTNIHQGLRTEPRSPRFNIVSRTFPTKHSRTVAAQPAVDDEDHIGDFSSDDDDDDEYQPSAKVARRSTRDDGMPLSSRRTTRREASFGQSSGTVCVIDSTIGIDHGAVVGRSGLVRPWTHTERPRIRDPTTSNPMNAASVASRLQQHTRSSLGTTDRFGTESVAKQRSFLRQQRNDIVGGSGVGAAGFTFAGKEKYGNESIGQFGSEDEPVATPTSASRKTSGKTSRRKGRTTKKTGTTRKRKVGGRRGGGWSGRRSRGGRGGGSDNVWGVDNQGGWQVSENFNSEDPAMKNIGGAEISF